jgi:hypothetical protein
VEIYFQKSPCICLELKLKKKQLNLHKSEPGKPKEVKKNRIEIPHTRLADSAWAILLVVLQGSVEINSQATQLK